MRVHKYKGEKIVPDGHGLCMQAIDPCFPAPNAEAAAMITPLTGFDVLIDTPSGRNMRRTISGSGKGAYNSTLAAAARAVRKTSSNNGNPETAAVARSNSNTSSSSAAVATGSGSASCDEDDSSVAEDRSLQKTNRTNADDSNASRAVAAEGVVDQGADALKQGSPVSKQLVKSASSNAAAAVYQQNLVIRTMRKTNSGLAASRAAFRV